MPYPLGNVTPGNWSLKLSLLLTSLPSPLTDENGVRVCLGYFSDHLSGSEPRWAWLTFLASSAVAQKWAE